MPVMRVDNEVFTELQKRVSFPFYDCNDVLRKLLGLKAMSKGLPQAEYRIPILRALEEKGGRASYGEIRDAVESKLKSRFTPEDFEPLKGSIKIRWQKRLRSAARQMVREGLMLENVPRGVWEITEKGRQWLSSQNDSMEHK